jgi:prolyl oligopeptidase
MVVSNAGESGWTARPRLSAPVGVSLSIIKPDGVGTCLLVKQEGFLAPASVSLVSPAKDPVQIAAGKAIIDASAFRVDVRSARSKDGTLVDYYLVHPQNPKPGPVPTLMSGYGSFGVNFDPDYFSSGLGRGLASWLSRGGAYAATAIRGGGERGEAWHLAGVGLNKQTSFDDFIAVAEDLVRRGFTTRAKLGAFGRSGGGLLTAAMVAERPDLFGALYVGVPVTDVGALSTSGSGIIKGQKSEFGDWDDPKALRTILAYSPYQNLRSGVYYPPILIMTSTEDNQVGPGQARKFAARLEDVGAKPLLIEEPLGGHGVPDQIRQPDVVAAETVFFIDALMK